MDMCSRQLYTSLEKFETIRAATIETAHCICAYGIRPAEILLLTLIDVFTSICAMTVTSESGRASALESCTIFAL